MSMQQNFAAQLFACRHGFANQTHLQNWVCDCCGVKNGESQLSMSNRTWLSSSISSSQHCRACDLDICSTCVTNLNAQKSGRRPPPAIPQAPPTPASYHPWGIDDGSMERRYARGRHAEDAAEMEETVFDDGIFDPQARFGSGVEPRQLPRLESLQVQGRYGGKMGDMSYCSINSTPSANATNSNFVTKHGSIQSKSIQGFKEKQDELHARAERREAAERKIGREQFGEDMQKFGPMR